MAKTILLADDSVTIQKVVELTFMGQGYEVTAVSDGSTALAKLAEAQPDIVIADVHMPGANGYEVAVQSKQRFPGMPVLLLVGTFEPFDEQQMASSGADAFLKKPFDSQDLMKQVEQLIASAGPPYHEETQPLEPLGEADLADLSPPATEFQASPPAADPFGEASSSDQDTADLPPLTLDDIAVEPAPQIEPPATGFSMAPPAFETPTLETPTLETPALETPAFETPALETPLPEPPAFEAESEPELPLDLLQSPDSSEVPVPAPEAVPPMFAGPLGGGPAAQIAPDPEPTAAEPELSVAEPSFAEPSFAESSVTEPNFAEPVAAIEPEPVFEPEPVAVSEPEPMTVSEPEPASVGVPEPLAATEPAPEPASVTPDAAPVPEPAASEVVEAPPNGGGWTLNDSDIERIAQRVAEIIGDSSVRAVAWEIVPDLAEVIIRERIRELESQVE